MLPNRRRARELQRQIDELRLEYAAACEAGNFSEAQDLREAIAELEDAYFMTGVTHHEH